MSAATVNSTPQAFFIPAGSAAAGQRFCIFYPAQGELRGRVVYVHPFAEEMNRSRRMAAMQARALAAAGFSVLQIDLHGCGDSSGDFGDATWSNWISDVLQACTWLRQRDAVHTRAPLWLWGMRAGCLLAAEAATRLDEACNFCFWQPAVAGRLQLQQFLRLKLAGDMLSGNSKGLMDAMHQQLAQDKKIEIAGYMLSPALANGLEQAQLIPPAMTMQRPRRLEWFELSSSTDAAVGPLSAQAQCEWASAGYQVKHHWVHGPAFWQTTELEDAVDLIAATVSAMLASDTVTAPQTTSA